MNAVSARPFHARRQPRIRRLSPLALLCLALPVLASDLRDGRIQSALDQGLRPTVVAIDAPLPAWSLASRMQHHQVTGVAIAVLRDGRLVHATGYGSRRADASEPVDADTLFSVGSVSKMVTAATSLRLVAAGTLALDTDIDTTMTSWTLPGSDATPRPNVTLRMLLSHTAGLGVHGFADFQPGEAMPTLLQVLDGTPPAKNPPVRLVRPPGEVSDYSGGGFMVAQQLLEDAGGQPIDALARSQVFAPLRMTRSSFASPLPADTANVAAAHDRHGRPAALPRGWESFPELAASGLWTSAGDLALFVAALTSSYRGQGGFLPRTLAVEMMTEVSPSWHGLGPRLDGEGASRLFHHGGSNDSYRAWIEGHLETGDGLVILTNGANGAALAAEIRNALTDALGTGINPPVRTVNLDPHTAGHAGLAGIFDADPRVPVDLRRSLADLLDVPALQVRSVDGQLRVGVPGTPYDGVVLPLAPNLFVSPDIDGLRIEFHRDAHGQVRGLTASHGRARAWFGRRAPR